MDFYMEKSILLKSIDNQHYELSNNIDVIIGD